MEATATENTTEKKVVTRPVTLSVDKNDPLTFRSVGMSSEEADAFRAKLYKTAETALGADQPANAAEIISDELTDKEASFLVIYGAKRLVEDSQEACLRAKLGPLAGLLQLLKD